MEQSSTMPARRFEVTRFSRTPGRVAGPAPRLGAHTAEIMDEFGDASG